MSFHLLSPKPLMDVKHDSSLMPGPVEAICHTYAIFPFDLFQMYTAIHNLQ